MLKIYTSRINYNGSDKIDISIKSGSKLFAPTWDMVMGYKNGKINQEEYTKSYYELMKKSYFANKEEWLSLLDKEEITFCCYCSSNDFCHRILLANIFEKIGKTFNKKVKYEGER